MYVKEANRLLFKCFLLERTLSVSEIYNNNKM